MENTTANFNLFTAKEMDYLCAIMIDTIYSKSFCGVDDILEEIQKDEGKQTFTKKMVLGDISVTSEFVTGNKGGIYFFFKDEKRNLPITACKFNMGYLYEREGTVWNNDMEGAIFHSIVTLMAYVIDKERLNKRTNVGFFYPLNEMCTEEINKMEGKKFNRCYSKGLARMIEKYPEFAIVAHSAINTENTFSKILKYISSHIGELKAAFQKAAIRDEVKKLWDM